MKFSTFFLTTLFALGFIGCSPKTGTTINSDTPSSLAPATSSQTPATLNGKPLPHGARPKTEVNKIEFK